MTAESLTSPPSVGTPLLFGSVVAGGTLLLDVLNSPVFARSLGAIVTLLLILSAAWESWKNKRSRRQDEKIAVLEALEANNRTVIAGLLRNSGIAKNEIEELRFQADKSGLDLAQANMEILRIKGVVAYSGQRIPLRPSMPPSLTNVLIVEDDEATRQYFTKVLGHYGYRITAIGSVHEAVEQIRRRGRTGPRFDFVICDLILPDGSGLEVIESLRGCSPESAAIVVSGSIDEVTLAKAQSQASAFLVKPVDFDELLALLGCMNGDHKPTENSRP